MQYIKSTFSLLIITSLLVISLSSCGQLSELDSHSIVSRFQKSEDLYAASMRWGDWGTLLHLLKNKPVEGKDNAPLDASAKKKNADDYQALTDKSGNSGSYHDINILTTPSEDVLAYLKTFNVSEVKALTSGMRDVKEDGGSGTTLFEIRYRKESSLKISTIRHKVNWWYHKESNSWFTDTPLPEAFQPPKKRTIKLSPKKY